MEVIDTDLLDNMLEHWLSVYTQNQAIMQLCVSLYLTIELRLSCDEFYILETQ